MRLKMAVFFVFATLNFVSGCLGRVSTAHQAA
nr:MAG TPA: hypothetical protein [Caudoviricetes sp.]